MTLLEELAGKAAFRPALQLDEHAALHVPFRELGFDADPEAMVAESAASGAGLTLLVGEPGHGKSSLLARVAADLSDAAEDGRRLLPLFVPVAPRGAAAADLKTFGAMAIGNLLAGFGDLADDQRRAFESATAEQVTREAPSRSFNAKLSAKVFGTGVEGGAESKGEVVTITTSGDPLDAYGGLTTLAHTLRGRDRQLVLIVEDTDGWTLQSNDDAGLEIARAFFSAVLLPLAAQGISMIVAVQTRWTHDASYEALNERARRQVVLPRFETSEEAERALRYVVGRRMEWTLGGPQTAADVLTDAAAETLAEGLLRSGSMRRALTTIRDTLDQLRPGYPDRVGVQHLVESV